MAFQTNLPDYCYAMHPTDNRVIKIVRGESGYHPAPIPRDKIDEANAALGVTGKHVQAMMIGSMFGWHVPGAQL